MISYCRTNSYGKKVPFYARIRVLGSLFIRGGISTISNYLVLSYAHATSSVASQPWGPIVDFSAKTCQNDLGDLAGGANRGTARPPGL